MKLLPALRRHLPTVGAFTLAYFALIPFLPPYSSKPTMLPSQELQHLVETRRTFAANVRAAQCRLRTHDEEYIAKMGFKKHRSIWLREEHGESVSYTPGRILEVITSANYPNSPEPVVTVLFPSKESSDHIDVQYDGRRDIRGAALYTLYSVKP